MLCCLVSLLLEATYQIRLKYPFNFLVGAGGIGLYSSGFNRTIERMTTRIWDEMIIQKYEGKMKVKIKNN
jgi:hypothetical protein